MFKMVGICWRIQVYIVRQQWQKLGNSPITRPRNITAIYNVRGMSIIRANLSVQRKIKLARFEVTKMDAVENEEECLLATSCDYGQADISSAFHPPSVMTSNQTFMAGKDQEVAPKLDGPILSNMTSILLASTPTMLPSGRPLLADCQCQNPSRALNQTATEHQNFGAGDYCLW